MGEALALADEAAALGDVPVGAVVVIDDQIVGRGRNQMVSANDPTAHAEIVALRQAAARVGNYRLTGATLYVTVEPCLMCVGAMAHARIAAVVYGTNEPRTGVLESTGRLHDHASLNHRIRVVSGVRAPECRARMQAFFADRRG